jgi:purine-binding chemotaxis protein CheW
MPSAQYCTFSLGDHYFGLPIEQVQEVIRSQRLTRVPRAPAAVAGLINLRGRIVTALDLRRLLEMAPAPEPARGNVVLRGEDHGLSLLVDAIADVVEVDESAFEPPPDTLRGRKRALIRGAYKLERQLLLVLDLERLVAGEAALLKSPTPSTVISSRRDE